MCTRCSHTVGTVAKGVLTAGILILAFSGCGDGGVQQSLDAAAQSVRTSLDTWKRGEKAGTPIAGPVAIEFFDDHWQRSARLVEYEVIKTYMETDATPRCVVRLVVQYGTKPPEEVQVTYQLTSSVPPWADATNTTWGLSSYSANWQLFGDYGAKFADIRDGMSNTIMFNEKYAVSSRPAGVPQ